MKSFISDTKLIENVKYFFPEGCQGPEFDITLTTTTTTTKRPEVTTTKKPAPAPVPKIPVNPGVISSAPRNQAIKANKDRKNSVTDRSVSSSNSNKYNSPSTQSPNKRSQEVTTKKSTQTATTPTYSEKTKSSIPLATPDSAKNQSPEIPSILTTISTPLRNSPDLRSYKVAQTFQTANNYNKENLLGKNRPDIKPVSNHYIPAISNVRSSPISSTETFAEPSNSDSLKQQKSDKATDGTILSASDCKRISRIIFPENKKSDCCTNNYATLSIPIPLDNFTQNDVDKLVDSEGNDLLRRILDIIRKN